MPDGPVGQASLSRAGWISGWGAEIPHAPWPKNQNIKHKQYFYKFNKDFKNGPQEKNPGKKSFLNRNLIKKKNLQSFWFVENKLYLY